MRMHSRFCGRFEELNGADRTARARREWIRRAALLILLVFSPLPALADTAYSYTGQITASFNLAVPDAGIAAGTDETANVTNFQLHYPAPPTVGGGIYVLQDDAFTLGTIAIGTNAGGNITSWEITGTLGISYTLPSDPLQQQWDVCDYAVTFNQSGSTTTPTFVYGSDCPSSIPVSAGDVWRGGAVTAYEYTHGGIKAIIGLATAVTSLPGTNVTSGIAYASWRYPLQLTNKISVPVNPASSTTLDSVTLITDASGNITNWDIAGTQFDSYSPVGTDPNLYYCIYSIAFVPPVGYGTLTTDGDFGWCVSPSIASTGGTWTAAGDVIFVNWFGGD